ncbi:hypothetical protein J3E69DRAFT_381752 [Trichoderma sp. SZMC 28015]
MPLFHQQDKSSMDQRLQDNDAPKASDADNLLVTRQFETSRNRRTDRNVSAEKRFKACRVCRKHKLRCERMSANPVNKCRRCHEFGIQCIYDVVGLRKRGRSYDVLNTPSKSISEESRHGTDGLGKGESNMFDQDSGLLSPMTASQPHHGSVNESTTNLPEATATPSLTSNDLQAPVSAMHNMSPYQETTYPETKTALTMQSGLGDRYTPRSRALFGKLLDQPDIISKGLLGQDEARSLFNVFMTTASNLLPIFDPILDSFDALRNREPFCFAVILALACRIEGVCGTNGDISQLCLEEVKRMVAGSLFQYSATLGNVQAIILLAAYADNTWFAIGHGLQMALDLHLDKTLSQLRLPGSEGISNSRQAQRGNQLQIIRKARVWLALCFMEREIAIGTARCTRMTGISLDDLRNFSSHPQVHPSGLRLASLVEAVQLRGDLLLEITASQDLLDTGLCRLRRMESLFEEWAVHWDALHEEYGFEAASFQRTSLRGQKNYAMILLGCATLSRLGVNRQLSAAMKGMQGVALDVLQFVLSTVMAQLKLVLRAESYKWHLKWATNYTILSLSFTTILALEFSRHRPDLSNIQEVLNTIMAVMDILKKYHDPFFFYLIQARLAQHPGISTLREQDPNWDNTQLHPAFSPGSVGVQSSQNLGELDNSYVRSTKELDSRQAGKAPEAEVGRVDFHNTLDHFLETPEWIMNPSSMLEFDFSDWGSTDGHLLTSQCLFPLL